MLNHRRIIFRKRLSPIAFEACREIGWKRTVDLPGRYSLIP
jgi:hypothetical protein